MRCGIRCTKEGLELSRQSANLKSKTEAIERMLNGENFFNGVELIRFQEFKSKGSHHYGGIPFNNVRKEAWDNFRRWETNYKPS